MKRRLIMMLVLALTASVAVSQVLPWQVAPVSTTVGLSFTNISGNRWNGAGQSLGVSLDLTCKYVYVALAYARDNHFLHIHAGNAYYPFNKVLGGIGMNHYKVALGPSVPLKWGQALINLSPYMGMGIFHIGAGESFLAFDRHALPHHNYPTIGPGLKAQLTFDGHYVIGMGYERQFFTRQATPVSANAVTAYLGYMF